MSENKHAALAILKSGIVHNRNLLSNEMHNDVAMSKGASTPSNIASNIAGNSFHLTSGVQGGDIAGN